MASRRDFLKSVPLFTGAMALGLGASCINSKNEKGLDVGIQLWTLRDDVARDLDGTLNALAGMGYNSIEAFGFDGKFFGRDAVAFGQLIKDLGMSLHSTHTGITSENADQYAEAAAKAGLEYLVLPSMMGRSEATADDFRKTAAEMNLIGAACRKHGLQFAYHNHDFEFRPVDGEIPYDIFLAETDAELVHFQADLYWMVKAGKDPVDYFSKHPSRFSTWHIKDMATDGASCIIGNGKIDFKTILLSAKTAGLNRIFVEQEQYAEGTPLQCAEQSLNYIKKNLL